MGFDCMWRYKTGVNDRGMPTYSAATDVNENCNWRHGEFRGAQCEQFIKTVTGEDLRQEVISNARLHEMAAKLDEMRPYLDEYHQNICAMFRAYTDAGCVLVGSW